MSWRWRDSLYLCVGAGVGWHLNVCSRVEGVSMMPTLMPQDRLLHVPYWLWASWGEASQLQGRVVTIHAGGSNVVCKRVQRVTASAADVDDVHAQRFQSIEDLPYSAVASEYDEEPSASSTSQDDIDDRIAREHYVDPRPFRRTDWDVCRDEVPTSRWLDSPARPERWVWVEGDNAEDSFDSRSVGFVPLACVRDVVLGRMWPSPRAL